MTTGTGTTGILADADLPADTRPVSTEAVVSMGASTAEEGFTVVAATVVEVIDELFSP